MAFPLLLVDNIFWESRLEGGGFLEAVVQPVSSAMCSVTCLLVEVISEGERRARFEVLTQPMVLLTLWVYAPSQKVLTSLNKVFRLALGLSTQNLSPSMGESAWGGGGGRARLTFPCHMVVADDTLC